MSYIDPKMPFFNHSKLLPLQKVKFLVPKIPTGEKSFLCCSARKTRVHAPNEKRAMVKISHTQVLNVRLHLRFSCFHAENPAEFFQKMQYSCFFSCYLSHIARRMTIRFIFLATRSGSLQLLYAEKHLFQLAQMDVQKNFKSTQLILYTEQHLFQQLCPELKFWGHPCSWPTPDCLLPWAWPRWSCMSRKTLNQPSFYMLNNICFNNFAKKSSPGGVLALGLLLTVYCPGLGPDGPGCTERP